MDATADPVAILKGLAETVTRIEAVEQKLSPDQLIASPEPGAWSPNEILWHIRATADVHSGHGRRILEEDEPHWRHVSPRAQMKKTNYNQIPFAESLSAFRQQRSDLVRLLAEAPPGAWSRIAIVKVAHRGNSEWRLPLRWLISGMVQHEHGHCVQMESVANALTEA